MKRKIAVPGALLAFCSLTAVSCTSISPRGWLPENSPILLGSSQSASEELSPAETAKTCVITAESLEKNGHYREAAMLYERALEHDPKRKELRGRLAVLYDRLEISDKALAAYEAALAADPKNADLQSDLGYFYLKRQHFDHAERRLRLALELQPDHPRAQMNLGLLLAQTGRSRESYEAFAKVVGPAAAHSNVGVVLARQGRRAEAEQAFRQALAIEPTMKQPQAFLAYWSQPQGAERLVDVRGAEPAPAGPLPAPARY